MAKRVSLSKEVAAEYELVHWPGSSASLSFPGFGMVTPGTLTLAQAHQLHRGGFQKLKKKTKRSSSDAAKKEES